MTLARLFGPTAKWALVPPMWLVETRIPVPLVLVVGLTILGGISHVHPLLAKTAFWFSLACTFLASWVLLGTLLNTLYGPRFGMLVTGFGKVLSTLGDLEAPTDTYEHTAKLASDMGDDGMHVFFTDAGTRLREIEDEHAAIKPKIMEAYERLLGLVDSAKRSLWQRIYIRRFPRLASWFGMAIVGFGLLYYSTGSVRDSDGLSHPSFWDCLYFSVVTVTTTGFGDLRPASHWAQLACVWELTLGVTFFGMILAAAVAGYHGLSLAETDRWFFEGREGLQEKIHECYSQFKGAMEHSLRLSQERMRLLGEGLERIDRLVAKDGRSKE